MHYLLKEFNHFYQERLDEVDRQRESKGFSKEASLEMKLDILQSYVSDLGEQNINLIQTATELQEAAENRVCILEKLLQKTTVGSKEYAKKLVIYQKEMEKVSQEKLKCTAHLQHLQEKFNVFDEEKRHLSAENSTLSTYLVSLCEFLNRIRSLSSKEILFTENEKILNNINSLLEPVEKHLHSRNIHIDGVNDINKNNVFLFEEALHNFPVNSHSLGSPSVSFSCHSQEDHSVFSSGLSEKDVVIKRLQVDLDCLVKNRNEFQFKILDQHRTIATLQSQITELQHELSLKESECVQLSQSLQTQRDQCMIINVERSYFEELVRQLRKRIPEMQNGIMHRSNELHSSYVPDTETICEYDDSTVLFSDEPCNITQSNASTQTDINFTRLCMCQKELNRLQSTVIGLKIALAQHSFHRDSSNVTNGRSVKTDETTGLFKKTQQHHLIAKSVNLQLLELVASLHPCQESTLASPECKWTDYIYKEQVKPLLLEENIGSPVASENFIISDSVIADQSNAEVCSSIEELKDKILQLETRKAELETEQDQYQEERQRLREELRLHEAAAQDTRIVLTREVAERFDTIKSLRQEIAEQAEQHKETVQQLVLKTEVLKGLRKEMKKLQTKVSEDELLMEKINREKQENDEKIKIYITEIENQKITINNLQDALVQARRYSESHGGNALVVNGNGVHSAKGRSSSSRDVFDI